MTIPTTVTRPDYDAMLSVCTPSLGLDASNLMRALLTEQKNSGKRLCEAINEPHVWRELVALNQRLQEAAKL